MRLVQITDDAFKMVLPFKREWHSIKRFVSEAVEGKYLQIAMVKKYSELQGKSVGIPL